MAATVVLYAVPTTPPASGDVVVIDSELDGRMDIDSDALAV